MITPLYRWINQGSERKGFAQDYSERRELEFFTRWGMGELGAKDNDVID